MNVGTTRSGSAPSCATAGGLAHVDRGARVGPDRLVDGGARAGAHESVRDTALQWIDRPVPGAHHDFAPAGAGSHERPADRPQSTAANARARTIAVLRAARR